MGKRKSGIDAGSESDPRVPECDCGTGTTGSGKRRPIVHGTAAGSQAKPIDLTQSDGDGDSEDDGDGADTSEQPLPMPVQRYIALQRGRESRDAVEVTQVRRMRYRKEPSKENAKRIERAVASTSIYLISIEPVDPLKRRFILMGETGKIYTVEIGELPSCTCPSQSRSADICKHTVWVLLKVLRIPEAMKDILWQKALLPSELKEIFNSSDPGSLSRSGICPVAAQAVRDKYKELTMYRSAGSPGCAHGADVDVDVEACPACLGVVPADARRALVWCRGQCGRVFHALCWENYLDAAFSKGDQSQWMCDMCGSQFVGPLPEAAGSESDESGSLSLPPQPYAEEGYLNLVDYQPGQTADRPIGETYHMGWESWYEERGRQIGLSATCTGDTRVVRHYEDGMWGFGAQPNAQSVQVAKKLTMERMRLRKGKK